jgi:hypothetical protein
MFRAIIVAFFLTGIAACATAPAPTRSNLQGFSVISEQADAAAGTLTVLIRISGPATEANVKSIAESVIASRRADYAHVIVKSYVEGATASDPPLAISRLENGAITHRFNPMAETQKIQTH